MKIGIIGGTGAEARGIALRWAKAGHDVTIGSRDRARGEAKAQELSEQFGVTLKGSDNAGCVEGAEVVLLSIPYAGHRETLESLKDALQGKILIDITVPLKPPKVRSVNLPEGQSAALEAQQILGDGVTVAATLHHVSAHLLEDLDHEPDCDALVACNDKEVRQTVIDLMGDLGLRGISAGVLRNAIALESLTPVLIYINGLYKTHA
ncbi:MAG: NADPH-dependent F420 reductase, partial [Candidatus Dadabacteria bacterium]